jgi:hypothetical protein
MHMLQQDANAIQRHAKRAELHKCFRDALSKGRSVSAARELLDVNGTPKADPAEVIDLIRDSLAQPRRIGPSTNGTLQALPLRRPDPRQPIGATLLDALARR